MKQLMVYATCDYCGDESVVTYRSPVLADVTLNVRMCRDCWEGIDLASGGQIGEFPVSDAS